MIAETLALALALAAPAARPAPEAGVDNATRARRGLLPRKASRPKAAAARGRRIVLFPAAPVWLGEPTGVPDPGAEPLLEAAVAALPPEEREREAPLVLTVEGADVAMLLVRRAPSARVHPPVRAELSGAEVVGVMLLRRAPR